jgi:hypothetical protein
MNEFPSLITPAERTQLALSRAKLALRLAKSARRDLDGEHLMSSGPTLAAFDKIITLLETTETGEGSK